MCSIQRKCGPGPLDHGAHQCLADAEAAGLFDDEHVGQVRRRYDPTHDVHHPYDVFIAQEQNLAWDARLLQPPHRRRRVPVDRDRQIAGLAVANATLLDTLLSFFVPSLAA